MKAGQTSTTAVWVCRARARAHGRSIPQFSDPTALALLPAEVREKVERERAGSPAASFRERMRRSMLDARTAMIVARTVEIDNAIRAAAHPQLVILGAGLDGRAWRMPELRDATVFEVDHPDTQREKRARIDSLTRAAGDVRFVPVDFARDSLDAALSAAGHDPARPTTWAWEGVIMYLTQDAIDTTLSVIARRSARPSRLVVNYLTRALMVRIVGLLVRRVGEPFRSFSTPDAMRALLASHGFAVARDENIVAIAHALSPQLAHEARFVKYMRIATADRA